MAESGRVLLALARVDGNDFVGHAAPSRASLAAARGEVKASAGLTLRRRP